MPNISKNILDEAAKRIDQNRNNSRSLTTKAMQSNKSLIDYFIARITNEYNSFQGAQTQKERDQYLGNIIGDVCSFISENLDPETINKIIDLGSGYLKQYCGMNDAQINSIKGLFNKNNPEHCFDNINKGELAENGEYINPDLSKNNVEKATNKTNINVENNMDLETNFQVSNTKLFGNLQKIDSRLSNPNNDINNMSMDSFINDCIYGNIDDFRNDHATMRQDSINNLNGIANDKNKPVSQRNDSIKNIRDQQMNRDQDLFHKEATAYMAAKKLKDSRGFFSKLGNLKRTYQEYKQVKTMRENLQNNYKLGEDTMKYFDTMSEGITKLSGAQDIFINSKEGEISKNAFERNLIAEKNPVFNSGKELTQSLGSLTSEVSVSNSQKVKSTEVTKNLNINAPDNLGAIGKNN